VIDAKTVGMSVPLLSLQKYNNLILFIHLFLPISVSID